MKRRMATPTQCPDCSHEIAPGAPYCQNCGTKITGNAAAVTREIEMPTVAVFCSIMAWLSIAGGGLMMVAAIAESGFNKPDQTGLFIAGVGAVVCSIILLALARGITLLAQIAHNTRKS